MRSLAFLLLYSLSLSIQAASDQDYDPVQIKTGNGFVRMCSDVDAQREQMSNQVLANIAVCSGYMMGLKDGVDLMVAVRNVSHEATTKAPFCLPDSGIELGQEVRIVLKYIRANPEQAHLPTSALATKALKQAFPCSTR